MSELATYRGTGKRKTSVARVILRPGDGATWFNGRTIDDYFPRASHQVILFSTDEEVTPLYYRRLAPAIGREYSIVFDEIRRSAVIRDGYFREAARAA